MRRFLVLLLLVGCVSCRDGDGPAAPSGPHVVPIDEDYSSIVDPLERWQAYGLSNYQIDSQTFCHCPPPTTRKTVVLGGSETTTGWTVDEVFELAREAAARADHYSVEYHPRFGYPTRIFVDWNLGMADEEIAVELSNLEKLAY